MGIITQEVEIKPRGKMIQYYRDKGYDANYNKSIIVKVEDLPIASHICVDAQCDICKDIHNIKYKDYNKIITNGNYYCCYKCSSIKAIETNKVRYGCNNAMQNKDVYKKQSETLKMHYGVNTPLKNEDIRKRAENTMIQNIGVKCSFMSENVRNKIRESLLKKYGVDNPSKSLVIREKVSQALYENSSQMCSKQQFYIFNLYKLKNNKVGLNYPVSYYNIDICFPEEKLAIEYDGGFHNGRVKTGKLTQEEFDKKEIIRNNIIKREGYKQMRIISSKDKLPTDTILLQMLSDARNYFLLYPNHSWIEFNIDTSLVLSAEYKDGVLYNFGDLRKIT